MSEFNVYIGMVVGVMQPPPSEEQVLEIARQVADLKPQNVTENEIRRIVQEVCPDSLYGLFEGFDNSTVNTALLAAIQAAAKKLASRP